IQLPRAQFVIAPLGTSSGSTVLLVIAISFLHSRVDGRTTSAPVEGRPRVSDGHTAQNCSG
ncbi:MAG TPA: hypothetical protein VLG74_07995, partial [Blastocatellia bacterium]|nr:hypothetical protein [Blastocatellia bacterium]